jgi:hypothetical protein
MKTDSKGRSYKPGVVDRLTGKRFGALVVVERGGNSGKFAAWLCRCDCGTEVIAGGDKLRRGKKKTCGTNGHRWQYERKDLHGGVTVQFPSEYQSWTNMRARCLDPTHKKYEHYGARGITICERWDSFQNFMLDMGRKPDPKFTIEREDVNGNYEPKNCKWISRKDQGRNKRNSVFVTYNGRKMLLIDLVEELGLSRSAVYGRLQGGWTLAQAIALPVRPGKPRGPYVKGGRKKRVAYCKKLFYEPLRTTKVKLT